MNRDHVKPSLIGLQDIYLDPLTFSPNSLNHPPNIQDTLKTDTEKRKSALHVNSSYRAVETLMGLMRHMYTK